MPAKGIGRLRRIFAGTTPTQRRPVHGVKSTGKAEQVLRVARCNRFFLTGCQGRFCRASAASRSSVLAHRRLAGWSGALTTSPSPADTFLSAHRRRHGRATTAKRHRKGKGF
jgi:hypothetical protein